MVSKSGTWTYDGNAHTKYEYTVTYGDESYDVTIAEGATTGTATLSTGDVVTITPAATAKVKNFGDNGTDNNTFSIFTANEQENFSVFIYDRMGRQVYTSNDLHFKWNGTTMDGIKCPQGAYTYVIYYRRPGTEDIVNQKGTVTLIR